MTRGGGGLLLVPSEAIRALAFAGVLLLAGVVAGWAQEPGTPPPYHEQEGAEFASSMVWAIYPAPPYMIAEGPDRETGIFDRIRHLLDVRLDGTVHRTVVAPFPRVVSAVKDGVSWCNVGAVRTAERDGYAVFSRPIAMFYPLRIVVHATRRDRLDTLGALSLPALLRDRDLKTSRLLDRTFGPVVDEIFRQSPPVEAHSDFGEPFRMLLADRLDYLVEYPAIAAYAARQLGDQTAFAFLPFAEAPEPVFNRVMCPKTDWGRHMVELINAILAVERPKVAYRRIVEAWSVDNDLATIRSLYDTAFLASE